MIKEYYLPKTLEEAVSLKKSLGERCKYLAGGSELNLRLYNGLYDSFVDLRLLKLDKIEKNESEIKIGSLVTFQKLIGDERVPEQLKKAANHMECRNIRNVATIGGNIGAGKTVGDLLPTLLVLDGKLKIYGETELVQVGDYISKCGEGLIEEIVIDKKEIEKEYNSNTFRRVSSDLSIIGVATTFKKENNVHKDIKIAVGGMGPKPMRLLEVEKSLEGKTLTKDLIVETVVKNVKPITDIKGSAEFKSYLVAQMIAEILGIN